MNCCRACFVRRKPLQHRWLAFPYSLPMNSSALWGVIVSGRWFVFIKNWARYNNTPFFFLLKVGTVDYFFMFLSLLFGIFGLLSVKLPEPMNYVQISALSDIVQILIVAICFISVMQKKGSGSALHLQSQSRKNPQGASRESFIWTHNSWNRVKRGLRTTWTPKKCCRDGGVTSPAIAQLADVKNLPVLYLLS